MVKKIIVSEISGIRAAACMPCMVSLVMLPSSCHAVKLPCMPWQRNKPLIMPCYHAAVLPCYNAVLWCYTMPCKGLQAVMPCMHSCCRAITRKAQYNAVLPCLYTTFYCAVKRQYKRLVLSFHGTIIRHWIIPVILRGLSITRGLVMLLQIRYLVKESKQRRQEITDPFPLDNPCYAQ